MNNLVGILARAFSRRSFRFPAKLKLQLMLLVLGAAPIVAGAQDLEGLASGASADLTKASAELDAARKEVEAERLPLARRLAELENTLAQRKADFVKAERFQENLLVAMNALKREAQAQSDQVKYVDSLLTEYAKAFQSRLAFVEVPRYQPMFDAFEKAGSAPDLSPLEAFARRSVLLTTALDRNAGVLGGELFDGQALDKQGLVQRGRVALIGPVAMFASTSGSAAGVLQQEVNKADPSVVELDEKLREAAQKLVTTGAGDLALDPTLGNAFKLALLHDSLFEKLKQGGLVMIPLLGLGVSALIIALLKWIQFTRIRLASERDLQKVLRYLESGEPAQALAHARSIPGAAGELLATAVEHADEKKEYIEEIVYEKMLGARTRLERGIAFLALTATAGPLMGLLGTVMGMIATFKLISSFGSGDPKLLAAGISEALMATATGMAVAIPALLLHAFLSRKAKGIIGSMEQTAVGFINGISDTESPARMSASQPTNSNHVRV